MATMKMKNGIRRLPNGTWQGRYRYNGKQHSLYGKTKRQVRDKLDEKISQIADGGVVEELTMTVEVWFSEWMQQNTRIKQSTRIRYERDIRLHILPMIGKIKLKDLTPLNVQRVYNKALADGLSPKSVYNLHGIVHEALEKAVRLDLLRRNVSQRCDLPKQRRIQMHPLTGSQVQAFLMESKDSPYYDAFFVYIFTGLRESQLIGLTWDCIDFDKKQIHVYQQLVRTGTDESKKGIFEFTSLKNDRERWVTAPEGVLEVFRKRRITQSQQKLKAGQKWCNHRNLVFTRANGKHFDYHCIYGSLKRYMKQIGRPQVRVHDLRHTYATLALENNVDIKTLSEALGHATVAFTLDRYGHKLLFRGRFHLPAKKRLKTVENQAVMA